MLFKDHVFRVVCRLFRKYYNYCENYEDFLKKIQNILNEEIIMECLKLIDVHELNEDKQILIKNLNNKNVNALYDISKKVNIMNLITRSSI